MLQIIELTGLIAATGVLVTAVAGLIREIRKWKINDEVKTNDEQN